MMQTFLKLSIVCLIAFFQHDIDSIVAWCTTWQLTLNISKCLSIRFGLVNKPSIDYMTSREILHNGHLYKRSWYYI